MSKKAKSPFSRVQLIKSVQLPVVSPRWHGHVKNSFSCHSNKIVLLQSVSQSVRKWQRDDDDGSFRCRPHSLRKRASVGSSGSPAQAQCVACNRVCCIIRNGLDCGFQNQIESVLHSVWAPHIYLSIWGGGGRRGSICWPLSTLWLLLMYVHVLIDTWPMIYKWHSRRPIGMSRINSADHSRGVP